MGSDNRLATPWLRTQLIEALRLIADEHWLVAVVGSRGVGSDALDSVLDLLDDTGAVDEPESQVGAFYLEAEVGYARSLSHALDSALGTEDPHRWTHVSRAASQLLNHMLDEVN